jgi:spoIIIJ-associated protein
MNEGNSLKVLVAEFLEALGLPYEGLEVHGEGDRTVVSIRSTDSQLLIGANGETLRTVNYLLRKIAEKKLPQAPSFTFDVNGYHRRKISDIEGKAKILAERVKTFKYNVEMPPMNAYERMIIHAAFQNDPDIETESQGSGANRHVVLKYVARPKESSDAALLN